MNYYLLALQKYATFSGRATRSEFWFFYLINLLVSIIISVVSASAGDAFSIVGVVYSLAVMIPSLALGARRLHDIGKSGWMQFVVLIPFVGIIWLIVLLAMKSSPEDNKYGPKPVVVQPV